MFKLPWIFLTVLITSNAFAISETRVLEERKGFQCKASFLGTTFEGRGETIDEASNQLVKDCEENSYISGCSYHLTNKNSYLRASCRKITVRTVETLSAGEYMKIENFESFDF